MIKKNKTKQAKKMQKKFHNQNKCKKYKTKNMKNPEYKN